MNLVNIIRNLWRFRAYLQSLTQPNCENISYGVPQGSWSKEEIFEYSLT